jgi:hypothetical protein
MSITDEQIQEIANRAAKAALDKEEMAEVVAEAVKQTLIQLGIDSQNPIEMQKDFQHLRQWRKAGEDLRSKSMLVLLGLVLTGLTSLALLGIREWFKTGP